MARSDDFDNKSGRLPDTHRKPPPAPERCMVAGCECQTAVSIAIIMREGSNREIGCSLSEYADKSGNKLREGYRFVRWVTRCAWHYSTDTHRAGKAQMTIAGGI